MDLVMIQNKSLYKSHMLTLLGFFHALYWRHWNTHWKVQGSPYYGDHLLFQRLYTAIPDEIDAIAEKIIPVLGVDAIDGVEILRVSQLLVSSWRTDNPIEGSYIAERQLQKALKLAFDSLEEADSLPLGHNDFIAAVANTHETHLYLIGQRLRSERARSIRLASRKVEAQYFALSRQADEIGEGQPESLPLNSKKLLKDQSGDPSNPSGAPSAEQYFYAAPEKREVREFAQSDEISNLEKGDGPPTPDENLELPDAEKL